MNRSFRSFGTRSIRLASLRRTRGVLAAAALVGTIGAGSAYAQTAGQIALLNRGGFYGNAVVAMSASGTVTSVVPLPAGTLSGIVVHPEGGPDLIVGDSNVYQLKNRVVTTAAANLPFAGRDILVMEDAAWLVAGPTSLLRIAKGDARSTFAENFTDVSSIAWHGSDGSFLVIETSQNRIVVLDRSGSTMSTVAVTSPRAAVWNPWTGQMLVAADASLLTLATDGTLSTIATGTPGLANAKAMFLKRDGTLFIAQDGAGPTGVYAYGRDGRFQRIVREAAGPSVGLSPVDLVIEHSRDVWPRSAARVGTPVDMQVNFPQYPSKPFVGAVSLGHAPGIAAGSVYVHVTPDAVLYRSLTDPSFFQSGSLDAGGNGKVRLFVPAIPAIAGLRVFAGIAVPDATKVGGFGAASDACGFSIVP